MGIAYDLPAHRQHAHVAECHLNSTGMSTGTKTGTKSGTKQAQNHAQKGHPMNGPFRLSFLFIEHTVKSIMLRPPFPFIEHTVKSIMLRTKHGANTDQAN